MKPGWRVGLPICTARCIAGRIGRFHREGATSRRATDGSVRSGSPHLEDKIVQHAVVTILNNIYEEDLLGFSYGFRPGRSQHKALDALSYALVKKKVNYVLDADIQGFFDNLDKAWMIKFVEHRVADRRILRLIQKWLKAGVMEDGKWSDTETGTPQGSVISPLLANIYLHYVFDLWVDVWRKKYARGEVIVLRYADDIVLGFQWGTDADRFRKSLGERLGKFGLELHPEKTRRIEFGRYAEQNRKRRGEGKPETFVVEAQRRGMIGQEEAANLTDVPNIRQKGTRLENWLTREQAKELLTVPDRSTLKGKRDYVIIALLVGCALRRRELASLKIEDILLREGRWVIIDLCGKG